MCLKPLTEANKTLFRVNSIKQKTTPVSVVLEYAGFYLIPARKFGKQS